MGRWSGIVTILAAVWIVFETINVAWPRNLNNGVWYLNWGNILMSSVLGLIGLILVFNIFRGRTDLSPGIVSASPEVAAAPDYGDT